MAKYKLIIIDDEYVVIRGLSGTIDWAALDIEIVAECRNGLEGLEAVHRLSPDLVISDIKMPKMDGLQLAKKLAEESFDGAVIIYSGYSDFEYARKAIDYGVTKYILKPIENEELITGVTDAIRELEAERAKRTAVEQYTMGLPLLKERLIEQVLLGQDVDAGLNKLAMIGVKLPLRGIVIKCAALGKPDSEFDGLYNTLLESVGEFGATGYKTDNRFVIITGLARASVISDFVSEFLERSAARSECRMSVGISGAYGKTQTMQDAYSQATTLCESYMFTSVNSVRTADAVGDGKRRKRVIDDALMIISTEYGKKLSVKNIAERLYVSESHLMHEFKESLGKTFNECLTECRIIKSKELLAEGRLRINEIASHVGYSDVRYFGQVFKDVTGITPTEYVENHKR